MTRRFQTGNGHNIRPTRGTRRSRPRPVDRRLLNKRIRLRHGHRIQVAQVISPTRFQTRPFPKMNRHLISHQLDRQQRMINRLISLRPPTKAGRPIITRSTYSHTIIPNRRPNSGPARHLQRPTKNLRSKSRVRRTRPTISRPRITQIQINIRRPSASQTSRRRTLMRLPNRITLKFLANRYRSHRINATRPLQSRRPKHNLRRTQGNSLEIIHVNLNRPILPNHLLLMIRFFTRPNTRLHSRQKRHRPTNRRQHNTRNRQRHTRVYNRRLNSPKMLRFRHSVNTIRRCNPIRLTSKHNNNEIFVRKYRAITPIEARILIRGKFRLQRQRPQIILLRHNRYHTPAPIKVLQRRHFSNQRRLPNLRHPTLRLTRSPPNINNYNNPHNITRLNPIAATRRLPTRTRQPTRNTCKRRKSHHQTTRNKPKRKRRSDVTHDHHHP